MALIWKKKAIFDLLFTIFSSHQGNGMKIPSAHIPLTYKYFAHLIDFFAFPILQKLRIYHVLFLFGVTPGVDCFSRHFGAINKWQNGEQTLGWNVNYFIYTDWKSFVISKPRSLNDVRWRLSSIQKTKKKKERKKERKKRKKKKTLLPSSSHFVLYR